MATAQKSSYLFIATAALVACIATVPCAEVPTVIAAAATTTATPGTAAAVSAAPGSPAAPVTGGPASPANVIILDKDADFERLTAKGLVVVDFYAVWCGPCQALIPQLDAVARANPGKLTVVRIDIDAHPDLANRFGVDPIPDLLVMRDGKKVDNKIGYQDAATLTAWLKL